MSRHRKNAALAWASIALGLMSACDRAPTPHRSDEVQRIYPGATFSIPVEARGSLDASAEHGRMDVDPARGTAWYTAPTDSGTDHYRITDASTGELLHTGRAVVEFAPLEVLEITGGDGTRSVTGRYGAVEFEARTTGERTAAAVFRHPDSAASLEVAIADEGAYIEWQDQRLDGYGALSEAEARTMHDISTGPLARALTMVALDLGCHDAGRSLPLSAHAALLFPWQMILKYEVAARGAVIERFMSESACTFPGFADDTEEVDEKPLNSAVLWDVNHVIPMVDIVFPFDGDGERRVRR